MYSPVLASYRRPEDEDEDEDEDEERAGGGGEGARVEEEEEEEEERADADGGEGSRAGARGEEDIMHDQHEGKPRGKEGPSRGANEKWWALGESGGSSRVTAKACIPHRALLSFRVGDALNSPCSRRQTAFVFVRVAKAGQGRPLS